MFFADSVVTTSVVVGSIFFASDKLFRVEKLAICTGADFICILCPQNVIKHNKNIKFLNVSTKPRFHKKMRIKLRPKD